jgi:transcription termination factor NusB
LDHVEKEEKSEENKETSPFLWNAHDSFFTEEFLADVQKLYDKSKEEWKQLKECVQQILSEQWEDDMPYYLKNFFDKWDEKDIDVDYVLKMMWSFEKYVEPTKKMVNKYAESFHYEEMDIVDQAIFLLWYTEYKLFNTPKEILINEMIELCKRYSDAGSPKLVNWIFDKFLNNEKSK